MVVADESAYPHRAWTSRDQPIPPRPGRRNRHHLKQALDQRTGAEQDAWGELSDANWGELALGSYEIGEGFEAIGIGAAVAIYGSPTVVAIPLGAVIAIGGGGTLLAIGTHTIFDAFEE